MNKLNKLNNLASSKDVVCDHTVHVPARNLTKYGDIVIKKGGTISHSKMRDTRIHIVRSVTIPIRIRNKMLSYRRETALQSAL